MSNFRNDLQEANRQQKDPIWEALYREYFPNYIASITNPTDNQGQRLGTDRVIYLSNNKTVLIDEKVRKKDYGDILLETQSSIEHKTLGWIEKDLQCNYIAYLFQSSRTLYMLPWNELKRAWVSQWKNKYRDAIIAQNEGYRTECIPIPIQEVKRVLGEGIELRGSLYGFSGFSNHIYGTKTKIDFDLGLGAA